LVRLSGRFKKAKKLADKQQGEGQIGRLLGRNSQAACLFDIRVAKDECEGREGLAVTWTKRGHWRQWAQLSEGGYFLPGNVNDWRVQDL